MSQGQGVLAVGERDASGRRLLILDDDPALLRTVALLGRRLGAAVCTCSSLAELEQSIGSFDPDFVLVDLMMPEIDGIEVLSRIGPGLRAAVYVMSGADKRTIEASREVLASCGAQIAGFLQKPFSTADLARILGEPAGYPCRNEATIKTHVARKRLCPADFEKAVRTGEIEPYFQPIFHADMRSLKGFEALARIPRSQDASFAPEYVDQLMKEADLSAVLTDLVIDRSLHFLSSLEDHDDLTISINIFGIEAVADGFRERLVNRCTSYGIVPSRVILELSEAMVFDLNETDLHKVTQLRLAGFGLSIDDFGTGNSSLSRLASLPFSELKIDKSFCLALPGSETAEAVIEACLSLARRLDMQVIAEGIERADVAAMLTAMGCAGLQGHYFGQAMSAKAAISALKRGSVRTAA